MCDGSRRTCTRVDEWGISLYLRRALTLQEKAGDQWGRAAALSETEGGELAADHLTTSLSCTGRWGDDTCRRSASMASRRSPSQGRHTSRGPRVRHRRLHSADIGHRATAGRDERHERAVTEALAALGRSEYDHCYAEGAAWSLGDAFAALHAAGVARNERVTDGRPAT